MDKQPVLISRAYTYTMTSSASKRTYRIYVYEPEEAAPPEGHPILYVLDGNASFAAMVDAVRMQTRKPHGFDPAIVVGIGYDTDAVLDPARFSDFTPPTPQSVLPPRKDGSAWPETGGAESFLAFIEQELKPQLERELPVNRNRQTLLGHSLGGLFALHVLFTQPHAFQTYIAGSPSIWWNGRFVQDEEQAFVSALQDGSLTVRAHVLFGVGALERGHQSDIVSDAERMAARLQAYSAYGLHVQYQEYAQEWHSSVPLPLISQSLRVALRA